MYISQIAISWLWYIIAIAQYQVVALDWVLSMGLIEFNSVLLLYWLV